MKKIPFEQHNKIHDPTEIASILQNAVNEKTL